MKIQNLAIIFLIIIVPISLVLSVYTQFQIKTIETQTVYDTKLTTATYDAIKAFQLNTANSTMSDLSNSKLRDIEASIVAFKNSLMSTFELRGYTEEDMNNFIPALVYTMYDGFYIYSPYENINHLYQTTEIAGEIYYVLDDAELIKCTAEQNSILNALFKKIQYLLNYYSNFHFPSVNLRLRTKRKRELVAFLSVIGYNETQDGDLQ